MAQRWELGHIIASHGHFMGEIRYFLKGFWGKSCHCDWLFFIFIRFLINFFCVYAKNV